MIGKSSRLDCPLHSLRIKLLTVKYEHILRQTLNSLGSGKVADLKMWVVKTWFGEKRKSFPSRWPSGKPPTDIFQPGLFQRRWSFLTINDISFIEPRWEGGNPAVSVKYPSNIHCLISCTIIFIFIGQCTHSSVKRETAGEAEDKINKPSSSQVFACVWSPVPVFHLQFYSRSLNKWEGTLSRQLESSPTLLQMK